MIAALVDNTSLPPTTSTSAISIDDELLTSIQNNYLSDPWCAILLSASSSLQNLMFNDGLWFIGDHLVIPAGDNICECIFHLAHNSSGHFGFFKMYKSIRNSFFWPGMHKDLEYGYIPSCTGFMWNKSSTSKLTGPLHPLPVPDDHGDSISIDLIGSLPIDNGFNCILTITDQLHSDVCIIPTQLLLHPKTVQSSSLRTGTEKTAYHWK
jgi:Integrase zinc binding domain